MEHGEARLCKQAAEEPDGARWHSCERPPPSLYILTPRHLHNCPILQPNPSATHLGELSLLESDRERPSSHRVDVEVLEHEHPRTARRLAPTSLRAEQAEKVGDASQAAFGRVLGFCGRASVEGERSSQARGERAAKLLHKSGVGLPSGAQDHRNIVTSGLERVCRRTRRRRMALPSIVNGRQIMAKGVGASQAIRAESEMR